MMTIALRTFAWLLAAAVTFATLGPASLRPHSPLGQDGEHALAFILVGIVFGLAYPRNRLRTTMIAVVLIGVIELLQLWAPGRHARLEDFVVDALTACLGLAIAAALDWAMQRMRAAPKAS
jgi:VanZ family protein